MLNINNRQRPKWVKHIQIVYNIENSYKVDEGNKSQHILSNTH